MNREAKINFWCMFVMILAVSILCISMIFAVATLYTPAAKGNYSIARSVIFNCTTNSLTGAVNASLWYNASGGDIYNASGGGDPIAGDIKMLDVIANTSANQTIFKLTGNASRFNVSSLASGVIYNFSCLIRENSENVYEWSGGAVNVTIDTRSPPVHAGNFTTYSLINSTGNYSQNNCSAMRDIEGKWDKKGLLTFNITVKDVSLTGSGSPIYTNFFNISSVFFNITVGSTGLQFLKLDAIFEGGATNFWSKKINATNFTDGTYIIKLYANDSLSNMNNTAEEHSVYNVTIDNTAPVADLSTLAKNYSNPLNYTTDKNIAFNYSKLGGGLLTLNVSVTDATVGMCGTPYLYLSLNNATPTLESNSLFHLAKERACSGGTTIFWSNFTSFNSSEYKEGNYTFSLIINDTLKNTNGTAANSSVISSAFFIDRTVPNVSSSDIQTPLASGVNLSENVGRGLLSLNISITDYTGGNKRNGSAIGTVYFVITNVTKTNNATIRASREGTTTFWSTKINSTILAQNVLYNFSVTVNDSAGNTNNTPVVSEIKIDNSIPSVVVSCTPSSVTQGDTETCICTGSDAITGVNKTEIGTTSGTSSVTTTPSTGSTGDYTITCTTTDLVGLSASASTSYHVDQSPGGGTGGTGGTGGGGGTTTTWVNAGAITSTQLETGISKELSEDRKVTVTVATTTAEGTQTTANYDVGVSEVTATSATVTVIGTDLTDTLAVGEVAKFDLDNDGYYDISATLSGTSGTAADLKFQSIHEQVVAEELEEETAAGQITEAAKNIWAQYKWYILGAAAIIIIIVAAISMKKKKR